MTKRDNFSEQIEGFDGLVAAHEGKLTPTPRVSRTQTKQTHHKHGDRRVGKKLKMSQ